MLLQQKIIYLISTKVKFVFSTLSGYLNSVSGTVFEDFLKKPLGEYGRKNEGLILKVLVVIMGVISTLLVYMVENLGGVLSLGVGFGSVAHGPLLGMFILGMFFPRANAKVWEISI